MNRIDHKFNELRTQGAKALITYICAGDPNLEETEKYVLALERSGADIIELGVPFSDPLADGPVIQEASQRALASGTTLPAILRTVENLRHKTDIPLVLMTYYNPVLQYGVEHFLAEARRTGVDGLIFPDLPHEEAGLMRELATKQGIAVIPLVAPTSTPERLQMITASAQGFVYCVSLTGVTGARQELPEGVEEFLAGVRKCTDKPLAVGFGVSRPEQAQQLAPYVDGVIVGSAIVRLIAGLDGDPSGLTAVETYVRSLKNALV
ncbi:MAG: tryptophan synthase subunit alpha [Bacillota bacterium]